MRLINDIMEFTKVERKGGILVSLDFRKAFDSFEWSLIERSLDTFNFRENLKKMGIFILFQC